MCDKVNHYLVHKRIAVNRHLEELIEKTRKVNPTPAEREEQRRSFAYGNTKIENPRITRETVDREAEKLDGRGPSQ
jgi:hypothetical protein